MARRDSSAGIEVFIGIAGLAAHLPGAITAFTPKPVIGVPVDVKTSGLDALESIIQMPYPSPIATVGIDRGDNGAILAAQILGLYDEEIRQKVMKLREEYAQKVIKSNAEIVQKIERKYIVNDFLTVLPTGSLVSGFWLNPMPRRNFYPKQNFYSKKSVDCRGRNGLSSSNPPSL